MKYTGWRQNVSRPCALCDAAKFSELQVDFSAKRWSVKWAIILPALSQLFFANSGLGSCPVPITLVSALPLDVVLFRFAPSDYNLTQSNYSVCTGHYGGTSHGGHPSAGHLQRCYL